MKSLSELLTAYGNSDFYGFHMPGHKRNTELLGNVLPYQIDITEIEEFDDLHHASGILLDAQAKAAKVYGASETHYLVNGSTSGNLSAILSTTEKGGKILVARNSHRSVYNAIYLNELQPVYLYPEFDPEKQLNKEIRVEDVRRALEAEPEIQAVVIVSPTYDGVVSDVKRIAQAAHEHGVPLIVDEAHGAHFGFHPYFPENSNRLGADIVIHSVHKTMPSLTQTALLHVNGQLVNRKRLSMYLSMLQSSSPSYVLMGSIDYCIRLIEKDGKKLFNDYVNNITRLRSELKHLNYLEMLETEHFDRAKIIISTRNATITSHELYRRLLKEYHLQMEMVAGTYIVAMTSIADTREGFERLAEALLTIDGELDHISEEEKAKAKDWNQKLSKEYPRPELVYTSAEMEKQKGLVEQDMKHTYVAKEYSYLYPPGIPIVVPGERITREILELIKTYEDAGFTVEHT